MRCMTSGTPVTVRPVRRVVQVRRMEPDAYAGIAMLCVVVIVGVLVVTMAREDLLVPVAVWVAGFVLLLGVSAWLLMTDSRSTTRYSLVTAQVLIACALVITSRNEAGVTPILLMMVAAVSVYLVPLRGTLLIVALNTAVLFCVVAWSASAWLPGVWTSGLYLLLQVGVVFSTVAMLRERTLRAELDAAHVELQAAAVMRDAVTRSDERLRIARELHDQLGHQLTVLSLELETAGHLRGEEAAEHVQRAKGLARELLSDVRTTVGELRRRGPDLGEALATMAGSVRRPEVAIEVDDDVELDELESAVLMRVAQEVTTNAVRHSEATRLAIDVTRDGAGVRLVAQDNGWGAAKVVPGNGLRGMAERVEQLGGSVSFDGSDGFRVEVLLAPARVPVAAAGQ